MEGKTGRRSHFGGNHAVCRSRAHIGRYMLIVWMSPNEEKRMMTILLLLLLLSLLLLYADRVDVTKWGKMGDVMMTILLRAVLFGESISVPFPPCQGCVRCRCLHCISNTFRNIIKGESRLQAICEEGKCFFFSMASKQPTLLEPPPCFCSSVLMLYFAKSRLADVGISH